MTGQNKKRERFVLMPVKPRMRVSSDESAVLAAVA